MLRELALPEGGFASAQDADTDGVEGLTFTWTPDEGVPEEFLEPFEHGRFVLRGELPPELKARAVRAARAAAEAAARRQGDRRVERPRARGARRGRRRLRRDDWLDAARRLGEFLLGPLSTPDGRLYRTYRDGVAKNTGFLDDYADVAHGLYELHVATGEARWLEESRRLALLAVELFGDDERGGFFLTPADGEQLVARKKDFDDHPTPSGNSMLAYVLLRLARIYGDDELERRAVGVFRLLVERAAPRAVGVRLDAVRARPPLLAAARARDLRRARGRGRARRARAVAAERRRRVRPGRRTCRCSRARSASTASRRSTSARTSPAARPSTDPAGARSRPTRARAAARAAGALTSGVRRGRGQQADDARR